MFLLLIVGCIAGPLGSSHPPERLEAGSFRLGADGGVYTARRSLGWVYPGSGTGYQGRAFVDVPTQTGDVRVGGGAWTAGRGGTWGVTGGFLGLDLKGPLASGERTAAFLGLDALVVSAAGTAAGEAAGDAPMQDFGVFLRGGLVLATGDADVPRLVIEPMARLGLISIEGELNARVALPVGRVSVDPGGFVHCGATLDLDPPGREGCIFGGGMALTATGG